LIGVVKDQAIVHTGLLRVIQRWVLSKGAALPTAGALLRAVDLDVIGGLYTFEGVALVFRLPASPSFPLFGHARLGRLLLDVIG